MTGLLELGEEVDELVELLRVLPLQRRKRRHRSRGVHERARNRVTRQPRTDVREVGTWAGVPVLADLVAALTAGLGGHQLARRVLRWRLQGDRAWGSGERPLHGQVC